MTIDPSPAAPGGFSGEGLAASFSSSSELIRSRLGEGILIPGTPIAQGSMRVFGRAVVPYNANELKVWRQKIRDAIIGEPMSSRLQAPAVMGAVHVDLVFSLPPPKKRLNRYPIGHGDKDLDKLIRAVFDGLTEAGVWIDDSTATSVAAVKVYSDDGNLGARLEIHELH